MRRTALCFVLLASILMGVLIAGTPVNQDASPEAARAGIHLTVPPVARAVAQSAAGRVVPLALLLILAMTVGLYGATGVERQALRGASRPRTQVLLRTSARRGPPARA